MCVFLFFARQRRGAVGVASSGGGNHTKCLFRPKLRGERDPTKDVIRAFIRMAFLLANLGIAFAFFDIEPLGFFVSMALVQLSFLVGLQGEG